MIQLFRDSLQTLFNFTATDRGAFLVLLPLLVLLAGWPRIFLDVKDSGQQLPSTIVARADSVYQEWQRTSHKVRKLSPDVFDPNTLSAAGFRQMGLDSSLSERIVRYRSKGGKFKKSSDLLKMWGMDTAMFRLLEPFIRLQPDSSRKPITPAFKKILTAVQYDLNLADTADFESVPGIGQKMAARILRYRASLGGFVDKNQLYEVYGIDSLAVFSMEQFFIKPGYLPAFMDVNTATYEMLEIHPYLTAVQARAILFYRYQHGNFKTLEELKKVKLMDEKTLIRIRPYIKLSVP